MNLIETIDSKFEMYWLFHYCRNTQYNDQSIDFGLGSYLIEHINDKTIFSDLDYFINSIKNTYITEKPKIKKYLSLCKYKGRGNWQPDGIDYEEYSDVFDSIANYENIQASSPQTLEIEKIQWMARYEAAYKYLLLFAKSVEKFRYKIITMICREYYQGDKQNLQEILELLNACPYYSTISGKHNIIIGYFNYNENDNSVWFNLEQAIPDSWKNE